MVRPREKGVTLQVKATLTEMELPGGGPPLMGGELLSLGSADHRGFKRGGPLRYDLGRDALGTEKHEERLAGSHGQTDDRHGVGGDDVLNG